MSSTVQITLDETIAEHIGETPEQIAREAIEIIVVDLYRRHVISAGRAAELLDRDKWEFIRWTGTLGIPCFDMSSEQWQHESRAIEKL